MEDQVKFGYSDRSQDVVAWRRMRYLMTFLATFAISAAFCQRVTLSIAIVAMTDNKTNPDFETFNWDSSTKGTVLSSFFWGYVITNIPSGILLPRYGPRWILFAASACSTVATFLIPLAATSGGWQAICALRVIQGLSQGAVFPSTSAVIAKWAPPAERGRLVSIAFSGMQIGNILTLPISGVLAHSPGGWPSIFYVFGGMGAVWCILWFFLGFSTPSDHPYTTEKERKYIESFYTTQMNVASFQIPLKEIAVSVPVWALLFTHFVQNWGYYMLLTEMPAYMNSILKYDIQDNGALTCLPYIVMLILIFIFGWLNDLLLSKNIIRVPVARKVFNSLGFIGPMIPILGLCFVGIEEKEVAVVLLILSAGLNAGVYLGLQVNHVDLSPRFAGTLMGIINGIGNCVSLIVPLAVGAIVTQEDVVEQWQTVFWITSGIYLIGTLIFVIFGSSETQPWNESDRLEERL